MWTRMGRPNLCAALQVAGRQKGSKPGPHHSAPKGAAAIEPAQLVVRMREVLSNDGQIMGEARKPR
jgi:hypothetical protein